MAAKPAVTGTVTTAKRAVHMATGPMANRAAGIRFGGSCQHEVPVDSYTLPVTALSGFRAAEVNDALRAHLGAQWPGRRHEEFSWDLAGVSGLSP